MYDWVIGLIDWGGYGGVFLLMLLETIFPPIPSEVILPLAGMRAGQGALGLPGVIGAATAGAMVGNIFWYAVARRVNHGPLPPFHRPTRPLADARLARRREGAAACSGAAHPGSCASAASCRTCAPSSRSRPGLARMPMARFLLWSTLGTAVWSAGLAGGGYLLGARFERIDAVLAPVSTVVIVAGVPVVCLAPAHLEPAGPLGARMGVAVDVHEMGGIDRGVDLGRGQAGMAEQLLQRAQIGAAAEQMGGEAVAQGVRRRPFGEAERAPRLHHRAAHDLAAQRPAARAAEQRLVLRRAATGKAPDKPRSPPCTEGSSGTIRVLLRLPVTSSASPSGSAAPVRPSASATRSPEP